MGYESGRKSGYLDIKGGGQLSHFSDGYCFYAVIELLVVVGDRHPLAEQMLTALVFS